MQQVCLGKIEELLGRIAESLDTLIDQQVVGKWVQGKKETTLDREDETIQVQVSAKSRMLEVEKAGGIDSAINKKREVIRSMKRMRKSGMTYKEISKALNDKDISTFSGSGQWHAQTIHRLVTK